MTGRRSPWKAEMAAKMFAAVKPPWPAVACSKRGATRASAEHAWQDVAHEHKVDGPASCCTAKMESETARPAGVVRQAVRQAGVAARRARLFATHTNTCHRKQQILVVRIGGIGPMGPIIYLAV